MNKALYGLKQAPKTWNDHVVDVLLNENFTQFNVDNCLFIKGDIFALIIGRWHIIYNGDWLTICELQKHANTKMENTQLGTCEKIFRNKCY